MPSLSKPPRAEPRHSPAPSSPRSSASRLILIKARSHPRSPALRLAGPPPAINGRQERGCLGGPGPVVAVWAEAMHVEPCAAGCGRCPASVPDPIGVRADGAVLAGTVPVLHSCGRLRAPAPADFPHDVRPGERRDEDHQPDRHDAAAVPLGRLPPVPRAHAAGFPPELLGLHQRDGGECCAAARRTWGGIDRQQEEDADVALPLSPASIPFSLATKLLLINNGTHC